MKNNKGLIICAIAVIVGLLMFVVFLKEPKEEEKTNEENLLNINYKIDGNELKMDQYETENPVVAMHIKDYGSVVIELYPDIAPNTVNNFISLIKKGFYDNNTFHRLDPGFVLQGGDPTGKGTGGPGYSIKGEFTENGFTNDLKHEKGIVSMARATAPDTGGSQFFIVLDTSDFLDGKYAAFGKVIDGMENVETIENTITPADASSGKLETNLILEKTVIDLKGKTYPEPEKIK